METPQIIENTLPEKPSDKLRAKLVENSTSIPPIFFDMDGVVADLKLGMYNAYPRVSIPTEYHTMWSVPEFTKNKIGQYHYNKQLSRTEFWQNLPLIKDSKDYISALINTLQGYCGGYSPYIGFLTVCPNDRSIKGKYKWLLENYGESYANSLVPCFDGNKAAFCKKGAFLIDDSSDNIERWNEAGGNGILFAEPMPGESTKEKWDSFIYKVLESVLRTVLKSNAESLASVDTGVDEDYSVLFPVEYLAKLRIIHKDITAIDAIVEDAKANLKGLL